MFLLGPPYHYLENTLPLCNTKCFPYLCDSLLKHIMTITAKFEQAHFQAKQNKWMRYFTVFTRVALAIGFLPSGFVNIAGERFTSLSVHHPMGQYLEALHHTGYYYTFIGVLQVTAAILLLIPRTAILGALLYFPIILNICILSLAVRFEGSLVSSPLMVLANLYLLWWDFDRLKFILLPRSLQRLDEPLKKDALTNKFPIKFFASTFVTVLIVVLLLTNAYSIMPRNTLKDCQTQCRDSRKSKACYNFCDCIHKQGRLLDSCLKEYRAAPLDKDTTSTIKN